LAFEGIEVEFLVIGRLNFFANLVGNSGACGAFSGFVRLLEMLISGWQTGLVGFSSQETST